VRAAIVCGFRNEIPFTADTGDGTRVQIFFRPDSRRCVYERRFTICWHPQQTKRSARLASCASSQSDASSTGPPPRRGGVSPRASRATPRRPAPEGHRPSAPRISRRRISFETSPTSGLQETAGVGTSRAAAAAAAARKMRTTTTRTSNRTTAATARCTCPRERRERRRSPRPIARRDASLWTPRARRRRGRRRGGRRR
jgi:hypothetical protein